MPVRDFCLRSLTLSVPLQVHYVRTSADVFSWTRGCDASCTNTSGADTWKQCCATDDCNVHAEYAGDESADDDDESKDDDKKRKKVLVTIRRTSA